MNKEKSVCLITLIEGKLINFRENMSVIKKEVISTIMDVASRLTPEKGGKGGVSWMQPNGEGVGVDQNQLKCKEKKSFKPGKFYRDWNIPHIFKGRFLSFIENNIENRSVPCNM